MSSEKYKIDKPMSFLVIGSDYRSDTSNLNFSGARADALIVVTLTPSNARGNIETNILSIPRDTISYIPCGPSEDYYDKINSSLNYGLEENEDIQDGIDCTVEAVEFLMNIDIDYYVMATFEGVMDLVDSIGGIEVDSPYSFCTQDEEGHGYNESENLRLTVGNTVCDQTALDAGAISFEQGIQKVDGQEALAYARQRYSSSDYERNIRQQQVITGIVKKVIKDPTKYADNFVKVFMDDFYTNIKTTDLWNYINFTTTLFNNISVNLSNNIPVYVDVKTSAYENEQAYIENGVTGNSTMNAKLMSEYYDENNLDNFEMDTYITRNYITKESTGAATNLLNVSSEDEDSTQELEPIIIELSSYSISSTDYAGTTYTYFDFDTLYYASNLLRKSYNLPITDPEYDYTIVGIWGNQSYSSSYTPDDSSTETTNEPEVINESDCWSSGMCGDDFSDIYNY
ncbi:MAG: LCP family protein [Mycoplasmatales bacterium]